MVFFLGWKWVRSRRVDAGLGGHPVLGQSQDDLDRQPGGRNLGLRRGRDQQVDPGGFLDDLEKVDGNSLDPRRISPVAIECKDESKTICRYDFSKQLLLQFSKMRDACLMTS